MQYLRLCRPVPCRRQAPRTGCPRRLRTYEPRSSVCRCFGRKGRASLCPLCSLGLATLRQGLPGLPGKFARAATPLAPCSGRLRNRRPRRPASSFSVGKSSAPDSSAPGNCNNFTLPTPTGGAGNFAPRVARSIFVSCGTRISVCLCFGRLRSVRPRRPAASSVCKARDPIGLSLRAIAKPLPLSAL
jgi:hypothetical protein